MSAKGPKSVEKRKVKGHATDEMVATGTVRQADKDGNDHADEVAGFGAKKEQGSVSTLTTLYAQRHIRYQKMMARAHRFSIAIKKSESEMWSRT